MYAAKTSVSAERSRMEIEKTLTRYGATAFAFASSADKASVAFEINNRRVLIRVLLIPRPAATATVKVKKAWEQSCRSRWRSLALCIKAKLECVSSGITTFEKEFMAHILLPNGKTLSEEIAPQLELAYSTKKMPPLMLGMGDDR